MHDDIDLDIIGVLHGTDKSSSVAFAWDYLRQYQQLFAPWRDEPINLIEIGVANGASVNVWRSYFSRATIIGVDINPACARFAADRIVIEIGSQEDPEFLLKICSKYPPTIIIDDGSHQAHHIVYSFEHMFPMVAPGGIYVVEDLSFHFGHTAAAVAGDKSVVAPDYFQALARGQMARAPSNGAWGTEKYLQNSIESIAFFSGFLAVHKKKPRDLPASIAYAEKYLARTAPDPASLVRYAAYLLRHNVALERAEEAARTALIAQGDDIQTMFTLAEILLQMGKNAQAVDVTRHITELYPADFDGWYRLWRYEHARGHVSDGLPALVKAMALRPEAASLNLELCEALDAQGELQGALSAAQRGLQLLREGPVHDAMQRRSESLQTRIAAAG